MPQAGRVDENAEALEAHLDAFLDHVLNIVRTENAQARHIERRLAKRSLRDAIRAGSEPPRY